MTADRDTELQKERGTNERYMRMLQRGNDETNRGVVDNTAISRNVVWLGQDPASRRPRRNVEPLIGRVGLTEVDELLGTGFYIGSGFIDDVDLVVLEWAAPMARLFYVGPHAKHDDGRPIDIADSLGGRRTFTRAQNDLTGFEDELEPGIADSPFDMSTPTPMALGSAPSEPIVRPRPVAPPPSGPTRPTRPKPAGVPTPALQSKPTPEPPAPTTPPPSETELPVTVPGGPAVPPTPLVTLPPQQPTIVPTQRLTTLRAPRTVLSALNAVRTGRLHSLLRTLQPQQYELVTWPEEQHLIIQGHPGTGKTVIGLHRAAYLTDPARLEIGQRSPKGEVLVLGPTTAYVDHVRPVLEELSPGQSGAWSLGQFYAELGRFNDPRLPTESDYISTSSDRLGALVVRAAVAYVGDRTPKDFANHLFRCGEDIQALTGDTEVLEFLRSGKNHEYARGHSRFHPMLALAGLVITNYDFANQYRHIIVDEAQDLHPIDLLMLRLLVGQGLNLTLLGDMNQRRSDFTHASWDEVARELDIQRDDGSAPLVPIAVGYRSTNQILRFAAGLLPRNERTAEALRDGPVPRTVLCRKVSDLCPTARDEAQALLASTGGLVAILTMHPQDMSDHLRNKNWKRGQRQHSWKASVDTPEVLVLHPDGARGLEFDGVIVIEPADFPALLGRHGVLYTSLTRATKELLVIHSKALPNGLRPRR